MRGVSRKIEPSTCPALHLHIPGVGPCDNVRASKLTTGPRPSGSSTTTSACDLANPPLGWFGTEPIYLSRLGSDRTRRHYTILLCTTGMVVTSRASLSGIHLVEKSTLLDRGPRLTLTYVVNPGLWLQVQATTHRIPGRDGL